MNKYVNAIFVARIKLKKPKKGVGEWAATMICLLNLGRLNIFSYKNVALKRGIMLCHPNYKTLSRLRFDRLKKLLVLIVHMRRFIFIK